MVLVYVGLGVWEKTAGRREEGVLEELFPGGGKGGDGLGRYQHSSVQIRWIVDMVNMLHTCGGLKVIYEVLRRVCEESFVSSPFDFGSKNEAPPKRGDESIELRCCLTLMYLFIDVARTSEGTSGKALKRDILALEPKLLNYFMQIVARLRWDDVAPLPLTKLLLISWKTILVTFGGIQDIEHVKSTLQEHPEEEDICGQPIITASPLDYHLFRQEISSKYPAYQPPPPLFPLEPENNSILPPLKHRRPSYAPSDTAFPASNTAQQQSIMHQPMHIATPAPSPPPRPPDPERQMFPFLYPPLDEGSGMLGGRAGGKEVEGRGDSGKYLGSGGVVGGAHEGDEGDEVIMGGSKGVHGGGEGVVGCGGDDNVDVEDFELVAKEPQLGESAEQEKPMSVPPEQTAEQRKLAAVGQFYKNSLPHLQSVVIVILKAVLQNVTELVTRTNGQNGVGLGAGIQFNEPANAINGPGRENGISPEGIEYPPAEELDALRQKRIADALRQKKIAAKALTAILLLLLKWFKPSYSAIRVHDAVAAGLELRPVGAEAMADAGDWPELPLQVGEGRKRVLLVLHHCMADSRQGLPAGNELAEGSVVAGEKVGLYEESDDDEAARPPINLNSNATTATWEATNNQQRPPPSPLAASDYSFQPVSLPCRQDSSCSRPATHF
ncbi:Factor arrest protein 11 [Elasticomyces elasticus]|nr:Factor arrest protein 11 [Elasticomyces elasticus]